MLGGWDVDIGGSGERNDGGGGGERKSSWQGDG